MFVLHSCGSIYFSSHQVCLYYLKVVKCYLSLCDLFSVVGFGPTRSMELATAVLSGDRCLELRWFSSDSLSVSKEKRLTSKLCGLMNRYSRKWRKLVSLDREV